MDELAVIFDMDGVLVDSYHAHFESWRRLAEETGIARFTEDDFARTFGMTSREILAHHWPAKLTPEQIAGHDARKEELYRQIIRANFPEMPGARALVHRLHEAGFRLAVGTSGPAANIEASLEGLGHRELFGALVSGQDVPRGKPDPAIFLLAAERLGVPPQRCAVIEDAPAGVEAANRAGMAAIAVLGTASGEQLAAARLIVERLDELSPQRIAELIRAGA
jgi:beta-phosphoglucomutase